MYLIFFYRWCSAQGTGLIFREKASWGREEVGLGRGLGRGWWGGRDLSDQHTFTISVTISVFVSSGSERKEGRKSTYKKGMDESTEGSN